MNPDDVSKKLHGLTEIEEILIAQIFFVILVYCFCESQYIYHSNVINFPQDVLKFIARLFWNLSSLDILVVYH
ncbi:3912_t:CDS:1, partial [Dentiscutata erythropus]